MLSSASRVIVEPGKDTETRKEEVLKSNEIQYRMDAISQGKYPDSEVPALTNAIVKDALEDVDDHNFAEIWLFASTRNSRTIMDLYNS